MDVMQVPTNLVNSYVWAAFRPQIHAWRSCHRSVASFPLRCSQNDECKAEATEGKGNVENEKEIDIKARGKKAVEELKGVSVFFIGMMGCGKSTVGKIVADALGYYYFDSDKVVEQAAGGKSITSFLTENNEEGFRDAESEALSQLCSMCRLVVATGGGAVLRPLNWGHLRNGIVIWLDVPVELLAKRMVEAGKEKIILSGESPPFSQAFARLTQLYKERSANYASADIRICVEELAKENGVEDLMDVTPVMIASKVLKEIRKLYKGQKKRLKKPKFQFSM